MISLSGSHGVAGGRSDLRKCGCLDDDRSVLRWASVSFYAHLSAMRISVVVVWLAMLFTMFTYSRRGVSVGCGLVYPLRVILGVCNVPLDWLNLSS